MPHRNKVLVVDDSRSIRLKIGKAVAALGHAPYFAEDGAPALDLLAGQPIDAVLLDIVMPGMDGFEVLARLKADQHLQHIPVIVISGVEDRMQSIIRAIEAGAEDFLPKDFELVLLRARLTSCLQRKRLHDLEQDYLRLVLDWVPALPASGPAY